jgi:TonB family protein
VRATLRAAIVLAIAAQLCSVHFADAATPNAGAAPPPCDVRAWDLYPMPDGMTYAVVLRSQSGSTSDILLRLRSDVNDYEVNLPRVAFQLVTPDPDVDVRKLPGVPQYESQAVFVALPHSDSLLIVDAAESSAGNGPQQCIARHLHTPAYTKLFEQPVFGAGYLARQATVVGRFQQGVAAAAATLASTSTATCPLRYRPLHGGDSATPVYPPAAAAQHASGTVRVEIDLAADGSVLDATLYQSSGNPFLDAAALDAAPNRAYLPEIFRCEPIAGTYLYRTVFHSK